MNMLCNRHDVGKAHENWVLGIEVHGLACTGSITIPAIYETLHPQRYRR